MTIGIYAITHVSSGRKYIGKSISIERRLISHKCSLLSSLRSKDTNRHLYSAVQKYGWCEFSTEVIESFTEVDEQIIAERELYWIDFYQTIDRKHGFNLRRDSSTKMIVHPETREAMSARKGEKNPNFGNRWTDEMRNAMSVKVVARHASGKFYGAEWKKRQGERSTKFWQDRPEMKSIVGQKVSIKKTKYKITQYTKDGKLVAEWVGMRGLLLANPSYKRHSIYSACSGEKPSMYGFIWKKEPLDEQG